VIDLTISEPEHATILAALRYYQAALAGFRPAMADIEVIATNCGTVAPLDEHDIDTLCDRINS
jgi:hypothetical protein